MLIWETLIHKINIPLLGLFYFFLEYKFPLKIETKNFKRKETMQDVSWMFFNELISPQLTQLLTTVLAYLFWSNLSSYLSFPKFHFSLPLTLIIVFLGRDFIFWFYHLMAHRSNFLWRFHELHHSSIKIDWLAAYRGYWLDSFMSDALMGSIFFFVDVSSGFIYWLGIYELNLNFFIHTNLNFKMLSLQKWINNPHTHHWHHAKDQKFKGGQNFGSYTVIWDRLFGTFYLPENLSAPEEYGLVDNSNYPKGFISRFIHPFLK